MRLISCYIAGFGKFVKQSFSFSEMLVVIKEDNGWGKTTLADFIQCMLYGMDGGRSKSIDANERLKYEPWQGGVFGGSLIFAYNGRKYRIERTFGRTASGDSARLFDENEVQSFAFGEKAEHLGEALFGVDRDSYRRSVYIPQGAIETGSLPDDMKNRLLALLSGGGQGENVEIAYERLDLAEKALRARRKPAKGKLDLIEERLQAIGQALVNCDEWQRQAQELRGVLREQEGEIAACNERLEKTQAAIEQAARQSEWQMRQDVYQQTRTQLSEERTTLEELTAFFNGVEPSTVNVKGLQDAVTEFYSLRAALRDTETELAKTEKTLLERNGLQTQFTACDKAKKTYERLMAGKGETTGAGTSSSEKLPSKSMTVWGVARAALWCVFLFLVAFGISQISRRTALGLGLFSGGTIGVVGLLLTWWLRKRHAKKRKDNEKIPYPEEGEEEVLRDYREIEREMQEISRRLAAIPSDLAQTCQRLTAIKTQQKQRLEKLEKGIVEFLQRFVFREVYDYRVAVSVLKENIVSYARLRGAVGDLQSRLDVMSKDWQGENERFAQMDLQALKRERAHFEQRKEILLSERAKLLSRIEQLEEGARKEELLAEEEYLLEEKNRLEERWNAIRMTKELLGRAQENMATRYLEPVTQRCRAYLRVLKGFGGDGLRFSADGAPLIEENGGTHEIAYYSAGEKELLGFCTRIALMEALFTRDAPVLILDDPFVNLDDEKLETAKRFVKELSKKYQILYFTCKNERQI